MVMARSAAARCSSTPTSVWAPQAGQAIGQLEQSLQRLEAATGREFGDATNPLLVSVRSGAKFSMPGMMDTVLNLGLNDQVAAGLVEETGDARFVADAHRRLVQMFATVVLGLPHEPFEAALAGLRTARGVANDADLAAVLTYERTAWGNAADAVQPAHVKARRD